MKIKCINIKWSSKETQNPIPIMSLDFHRSGIFVTAACEKEIHFWSIKSSEDDCVVEHLLEIGKDTRDTCINCVRFSPCGNHVATGNTNGELLIWTRKLATTSKLNWFQQSLLKVHSGDVLDLCWSPDGICITSVSVDNTINIYNHVTQSHVSSLRTHENFVQGVSWDPRGVYIASQSADRTCSVSSLEYKKVSFGHSTLETVVNMVQSISLNKRGIQEEMNRNLENKESYIEEFFFDKIMFQDDLGPMFRRLTWSPDGSFLAVPTGIQQGSSVKKLSYYTTYLFSRCDFTNPLCHFQSSSCASVTRWCPILFRRKLQEEQRPFCDLPYRMYLAVANVDSVLVYDTESMKCNWFFGALHLANITDLAWSLDGTTLVTSSRDGFCCVIRFSEAELGIPLLAEEIPEKISPFIHHI
jgi:chromatin assembly factor 1 subunit B